MILADTSVWADHFRYPIGEMEGLLASTMLVQHPYVTGELALGNFKDRQSALGFLRALPSARVASARDFLAFVDAARLHGTGIGFVDAHLLAACRLTPGTLLWSRDKRLERWAEAMNLAWSPG
jgi:predicted nucleic acid-binding protein